MKILANVRLQILSTKMKSADEALEILDSLEKIYKKLAKKASKTTVEKRFDGFQEEAEREKHFNKLNKWVNDKNFPQTESLIRKNNEIKYEVETLEKQENTRFIITRDYYKNSKSTLENIKSQLVWFRRYAIREGIQQ